jgi:glycosyltransferase involved in cell wall biosynthesis
MEGVVFAGLTRTPAETARFYAEADVLVVPSSREVWGFVVNEALVAGLYVVSGDEVGAAEDLICRAPINVGTTFEGGDVGSLERALRRAMSELPRVDRDEIAAWGRSHTHPMSREKLSSGFSRSPGAARARGAAARGANP